MKQKQVKASPKVKNQTKKSIPPKKFVQPVDESEDDDDEEEEVKVVQKPVKQKAGKVQKVSLKKPVEDDDDEEEEEDMDMDEIEQAENDEDEQEEDDEDLCEDDEEKDDDEDMEVAENEEDEEEENEEDDDAPSEEVIEREEPTIPSKVKIGPIHPSVSSDLIVTLKNLTRKCTTTDIVEAFGKFGAIDQIHIEHALNSSSAKVVYKTATAALAALSQHRKIIIHDNEVDVSMKKKPIDNFHEKQLDSECTVYVKNLKKITTEEQLMAHFESCGEIEGVIWKRNVTFPYAFIIFKNKSSVPEAFKLHNSLLNGCNISVYEHKGKQEKGVEKAEQFTVTLKNNQQFQSMDASKLEKIFSKCGEISNINVVCRKHVLAFINFKTKESIEKALELNGKTEDEIELEVEVVAYDRFKKWTAIHVSNLPNDCTVADLTNIFKRAGEIKSVDVKKGFAVIRFINSDGYCKSFLYNEAYIRGHPIFVAPHSIRKATALFKSKNPFQKNVFKRPAANGSPIFGSKKPKRN